MIRFELPAVLQPAQGRGRGPTGWTLKFHGLSSRNSMKLLLHLLRVCPVGSYGFWKSISNGHGSEMQLGHHLAHSMHMPLESVTGSCFHAPLGILVREENWKPFKMEHFHHRESSWSSKSGDTRQQILCLTSACLPELDPFVVKKGYHVTSLHCQRICLLHCLSYTCLLLCLTYLMVTWGYGPRQARTTSPTLKAICKIWATLLLAHKARELTDDCVSTWAQD